MIQVLVQMQHISSNTTRLGLELKLFGKLFSRPVHKGMKRSPHKKEALKYKDTKEDLSAPEVMATGAFG